MDELIKLTSDLIEFKTTNDNPLEIKNCAEFIISYLTHKDIILKVYEKNSKISIVALFKDTKTPELFFNAHFDVVPGSIHSFAPKIIGDRLYGRGSEDCKAQIAVLMAVMRRFIKQKPDIGLMLTSDEEVHGENGVQYLLNELGYSCKFAIVADGGDNFDIVTKHKGVLQLKISSHGKTAHSARPWEGGENAIEKLIKAHGKIKKLFPDLKSAAWKPTASLNKISGGTALNQIPSYAELYLDIRRTEHYSEDKIIRDIAAIPGIQVEKIASADMLQTDENNPYIIKLRKSAQAILGKKIKLYHEHGATDARFFSAKGIPAVVFKAMGFGAHSETEYLEIPSIRPYFNILVDFISKFT